MSYNKINSDINHKNHFGREKNMKLRSINEYLLCFESIFPESILTENPLSAFEHETLQ